MDSGLAPSARPGMTVFQTSHFREDDSEGCVAPAYSIRDRKLPIGSGGRGTSLQRPPPAGQNQAGICLSVESQSASAAAAIGPGKLRGSRGSGNAATGCEARVITCGGLPAIAG